jgi:phospholipid/cholesterol/gamma-HCH transport system permease protein
MRGPGELSAALVGEAAGWWRTLRFGAVALATALSPSAYDAETREVAARQIYFSAWQVLAGFLAVAALLSWVLIGIVVESARVYGVGQYALEIVLRALPLELLPLGAALFVALRSGAAISTEVALYHIRGELEALERAGTDPLARELAPRVVGSVVAVTLLSAASGAIALVLAYVQLYGFLPWALAEFTRTAGQVFGPVETLGLALKTFLFGAAVAVIPIGEALATPRDLRLAPVAVLRAMVRLVLALALIEGAFLAVTYA